MTLMSLTPDERRKHPREPASHAARAWFGAGGARFADCTLQDLSCSGARIACSVASELPQRLFFAHSHEPAIFLAVVKWRSGDMAGVSFHQGFALDDCLRPPLDRLAAEWRALFA